ETCPQIPARHGTVGSPGLADTGQPGWRRHLAKFIRALDGFDDPEIADRKHVGALKSKDQKHFRGPAADALDLRQALDHGLVLHSIEHVERELPPLDAAAEVAKV